MISAIMIFATTPEKNIGNMRSMVWIGVRFRYVW